MKNLLAVFQYWRKIDGDFVDLRKRISQLYETNEKVPIIQVCLDVNVIELLDVDAHLGNMVMYEPAAASNLFQKFVFISMKALKVIPDEVELSQVHVVIKASNIPLVHGHWLKNKTSMCQLAKTGGPCVFKCLVTEISCPLKYTQVACYFCPVQGCEGSYGFKYVRVHVPGAAEQTTVGLPFTCTVCSAKLIEEKTYRKLADKIILHVIIGEPQTSNSMQVPRHLSVICRGEEVRPYVIGQELWVTGRAMYDTTLARNNNIIVEANVVQVLPLDEDTSLAASEAVQLLPPTIAELYSDRKDSKWGFALVMSYLIAECVTPAGTFVKLKLALLFSLLSSSPHKLNVLGIGKDTMLINRLMSYFSKLAPHAVTHSSACSLFGETRTEPTCGYFISGGSCMLAHTSLCVVPDLSAISKQEERQLLRVLEYNNVLLPVPGTLDPITVDIPCKIWACSQSTALEKVKKSKSVSFAVSQLFDLTLLTDELSSDYLEEVACQTLIHASSNKENMQERISFADLQKFLEIAGNLEVNFPEEVKAYLSQFYLASRQARADINAMPISALKTMLAIAESHARLSLRSKVVEEDALAAILLYEECLTSVYHHSVLSVSPEPHWKRSVTEYYLTEQNDEGMKLFKDSVDSFCKIHCSSGTLMEE